MTSGNWYALTVKPQHEFRVAQSLSFINEGGADQGALAASVPGLAATCPGLAATCQGSVPTCQGFVPTYKDKRAWSDRVKVLDVPLFSGYVFARFDHLAARGRVVRLPGVRSIVEFGGAPAALREEEIEGIRKLVESGFPLQPWPFLKAGERVRVEHGPLKGVEGVIQAQKDKWQMIVSLELLQRSVAVSLDHSVLRLVSRVAVARKVPHKPTEIVRQARSLSLRKNLA